MNLHNINSNLINGSIDEKGLFPHLDAIKNASFVFNIDFGLKQLPMEAGIIMIRGARQYGKSTWLEQELFNTISQFGPGSAFYLNGDNISDVSALEKSIDELLPAFRKDAAVQRIFIDEITAIEKWEIALKRMADQGKLAKVLVITTGSKATDLRRGSEKLPGRKGKLPRSSYLFTPISYKEFHRVCSSVLGADTLLSYLLSGGSPIACAELASTGQIPEYVIELVRDWVEGEIANSGRNRSALINIMQVLFRFGGTPVGQAKLAREAGLANNTVASGYIDILSDLATVMSAFPWDFNKKIKILRKPCKYHFTNLLVAVAYHPERIRSIADFKKISEQSQGIWYEWLIAQELLRRSAISGEQMLEPLAFWQNKSHEIDFVDPKELFIDVKRGSTSALEFAWFANQFANKQLSVINAKKFQSKQISGMTMQDFLLST
jgi:predicted AAA+ superfamily ATPase